MSIAALLLMGLVTWLFWSNVKSCASTLLFFAAIVLAVLIFLFVEFH